MADERANDDLAARVVAWHNRHPLARRITAAQVVSLGWVSFPFFAPGAEGNGVAEGPGSTTPPQQAAERAAAGSAPASAQVVAESTAPDTAQDTAEPIAQDVAEDTAEDIAYRVAEGAAHDAAPGNAEQPAPATPQAPASGPTQEAPAATSLRERARARAASSAASPQLVAPASKATRPATASAGRLRFGRGPRRGWLPAFNEDLFSPLAPAAVARWALRYGSDAGPRSANQADAAVRDVAAGAPLPAAARRGKRGATGSTTLRRLWVRTAAIDLGAQRVRVLVSPLDARHVLGPRIGAGTRAGALGAVAVAAGAAAAVSLWIAPSRAPRETGEPVVTAAAGPARPASAAVLAQAQAHALPSSVAPVVEAAAASASALPAAPVAAAPAESLSSPASTPGPVPAPAPARASASAPNDAAHASAPAPSMAHASAPALSVAQAGAPAHPVAQAPTSLPSAASATAAAAPPPRLPRPTVVAPVERHGPRLVPQLDDSTRRAAREASEAAREELAARGPHRHDASSSHAAATASAAPSPTLPAAQASRVAHAAPVSQAATASHAAPPATIAWAVSTRALRTRFESEQMLAALRDVAYRNGHGRELKLEVLPAGDDWRAVGWPLATRDEAERLRAALAARGLKAEVVQF